MINIIRLFFPIPLGIFGCSILINIQISINAAQYKVNNVWVSTLPFTQFIIIECARSCHIHESDKYKEILIGYNEFINIVIQVFRTHTRKHKTNNTNKLEWHKFNLILFLDWRWFHKSEYLLSVTLPTNCYFKPRCTNKGVIDAFHLHVYYILIF